MLLISNTLQEKSHQFNPDNTLAIHWVAFHNRKRSISTRAMAREAEVCEFGDISHSLRYTSEYGDYELWNQISYWQGSEALTIPEYEKECRSEPLWAV